MSETRKLAAILVADVVGYSWLAGVDEERTLVRLRGLRRRPHRPSHRRASIGALAGWVQEGKIKNKVDTQHGLENAPATLRRLFEGRNDGKQLLRVAE